MQSLDATVDPCDDFYKFACGNFIRNTVIPDEKYLVTPLTKIDDIVKEQLRLIVSELPEKNEGKPFKLAKLLFKECMNKTSIEEHGLMPLSNIYKMLKGWPVIDEDSWDEKSWDWVDTIKQFRKLGFGTSQLIYFSVSIDYKNSTKRYIDVRDI